MPATFQDFTALTGSGQRNGAARKPWPNLVCDVAIRQLWPEAETFHTPPIDDGVRSGALAGGADGATEATFCEPGAVGNCDGSVAPGAAGGGNFAGYAHLKRGSVTVKAGDAVVRGQVIGALGQSGNSAAPHLHFQVANAPTFEGSEGVPYVFDKIDSYGPESEGQLFGMGDRWKPATIQHGSAQLPLSDTVVGFPR